MLIETSNRLIEVQQSRAALSSDLGEHRRGPHEEEAMAALYHLHAANEHMTSALAVLAGAECPKENLRQSIHITPKEITRLRVIVAAESEGITAREAAEQTATGYGIIQDSLMKFVRLGLATDPGYVSHARGLEDSLKYYATELGRELLKAYS